MKLLLLETWSAVDREPNRGGFMARLHLDLPLLLGLLGVAAIGLVVLYSGSQQNQAMLFRQALHLLLGLLVMVCVAQLPPRLLRRITPWVYILGMLLLVGVLLFGSSSKGAQRWLDLGVIRFQPAELMKLALPMMLAWYFTYKPFPPRWYQLLFGALLTALPFAFIIKQPDLGTALLVAASGGFALFLAGISWAMLLALGVLLAAALPLFWQFGMHEYQRQRVLTFLNPEADPLGSGWNIIQSKIAIGSGGVYGKGWLNGTQSRLDFLPEGNTDFILAVLAEEFGLVGMLVLLGLYLFIIARGLLIAARAHDNFSRLLAGSLTLIFFFYVFVNAGMVSGVLPVVGLPLPLVSYGGTAVVTIMTGFGMLMCIATHRPPAVR